MCKMSTDTENLELYVSNFVLVKLVMSPKKIHPNLIKKNFLRHGLEPRPETFHVIYIGNHILRINRQINSGYFPEQHLQTVFVMKK